MIITKIITIDYKENFDTLYVEQKLSEIFESVVRWAITDICDKYIKITVSVLL